MAYLYVHGPEGIKGDWRAAAKRAGYKKIPKRDHPTLRMLILQEGGEPVDSVVLPEPDGQEEGLDVLAEVVLPDTDGPEADAAWRRIARDLLPKYLEIAKGEREVKPAQRMVLDKIMERGFGKAGAQAAEGEETVHVVILPKLGSGRAAMVCPRCLHRLSKE
jgi:hypothetical protein